MYRRRRPPPREVAFSFDSFLDLVANVCGIIIRLILVAWVGARTYHASMENSKQPTSVATTPKASDDPLSPELALARAELEKARSRLLDQLKDLEQVQVKTQQINLELAGLTDGHQLANHESQELARAEAVKSKGQAEGPITLAELKKHQQELVDQIKDLEKLPIQHKILRFRTPVSKPVSTDELMFECRGGRVSFIDLPAFMIEVERKVRDLADQLEKQGKALVVTSPIGAFRLNYGVERQGYVGAGLLFHRWVLEPIADNRGETLAQAVQAGSSFRQALDSALPENTVITFWVYPDSFGLFRQLRDLLYQRGLEVAGRPLPDGVPIMGASDGTASRGQ